ncbi:MAG: hypothetical protein U0792_00210 [Gemmataceae bacterium]
MKDLRTEPAGWFLTDTPVDRLPRPISDRNPVRWVEVMPSAELPPPFVPAVVPPGQSKLMPELRGLLADPAQKQNPVRVIVLFAEPIQDRADILRSQLAAAYPQR